MNQPLISVIMPAFNASSTLTDSVESVLKQHYQAWELIIINDGSSDQTLAVAKRFEAADSRITVIDLVRNAGLSNARNVGCKAAKGEFVCFLDSDDLWQPEKLRQQANFHLANRSVRISHTDFAGFDQKGVYYRPWKHLLDFGQKKGLLYPTLCYKNTIGVLTVMVDRQLLLEHGLFDAKLWTLEDQDLWIRIAKSQVRFGYIPQVLALYRITPGGISKRLGKYKRAYKKFIRKTLGDEQVNARKMWRTYYRHFGTAYSQKKNFRLSRLYFWKSIKLFPYDLTSFTTLLYFLYVIAIENFSHTRKN